MLKTNIIVPLTLAITISLTTYNTPFFASSGENQSNQGFPDTAPAGTPKPEGISGGLNGVQNDINNYVPPSDDCSISGGLNGTAGMEDSGKNASGSNGSSLVIDSGSESQKTATGEISGSTDNSTTGSTSVNKPGSSNSTNIPGSSTGGNSNSSPSLNELLNAMDRINSNYQDSVDYRNSNNPPGNNTSTNNNNSSNSGNNGSGNGNGSSTNGGNPPTGQREETIDPLREGNDYTVNDGNYYIDSNGNKYTFVTSLDFEKNGSFIDGRYELTLEDGSTISLQMELNSKGEWVAKTTSVTKTTEHGRVAGSESEWYKIQVVLEYGYWDWKNTTNEDWKHYYGDKFYPISGTAATSKTPGSTSIKWSLGHGPYDDGKWLVRMTPFYTETWERSYVVEIEEEDCSKDENGESECNTRITYETRYEHDIKKNVMYAATYYNATVPLVCDECPQIILCLGPNPNCDCGDLNTKCDDENDPELVIEHRVELDN